MRRIDALSNEQLKSGLHRAKEILGAHHADLKPLEQAFFNDLVRLWDDSDSPNDLDPLNCTSLEYLRRDKREH